MHIYINKKYTVQNTENNQKVIFLFKKSIHWYLKLDMCLKKQIWTFFFAPKKLFSFFSQTSKSGWDDGDGDVDVDGENFLIGKCCENEIT